MNTLEQAKQEDLERCWELISQGREFQREQGFVQWTEDYPSRAIIENDIRIGKGYVLKVDGEIAGYMYIDFDGEPAYEDIRGEWQSQEPYAVVHRLAFGREFRGRGLTDTAFQLIKDLCLSKNVRYIRGDTDFPNKRMQHIFKKNGFKNCGIIIYQGDKLAFDRLL